MTRYWVVFCFLVCGELLVRVSAEVPIVGTCDPNTKKCENGAKCENQGVRTFCTCPEGLTGDLCEVITDCQKGKKYEKCSAGGGTCKFSNDDGKAVCECGDGKHFDTAMGRCRSTCDSTTKKCVNGAKCEYQNGRPFCTCAPGLTGDLCQVITDCKKGRKYENCTGLYNHECTFEEGIAVCKCADNKQFDIRRGLCSKTCEDDDQCAKEFRCGEPIEGYKFCVCKEGLTGYDCNLIKDCLPSGKYANCKKAGGMCWHNEARSKCDCKDGKGYDTKSEACRATCDPTESDCANGAKCEVQDGKNFCTCVPGLTGDFCQNIIACETGGTYEKCSAGGGTCKISNYDGKAVCECAEGKHFDTKMGLCRSTCDLNTKKCENGAKCEDQGGQNFCTCAEGLTGDLCEVITDCQKGEKYEKCSAGGGTCKFSNDDGKAVCDCADGKLFDPEMGLCRNPCFSNPCKNDGVCTVINSTDYLCECKQPFSGNHCERHPCHSNPCLNDGTCIAVENNYGCVCDEQFYGRHCENDPCTPSPCKNAGLCDVVGIDFNCTCKAPYFGKLCEIEIDTTEAISDSTINDRITSGPVTTNEFECYCGENSVSCRLNWLGEKLCFCKKGYDQRGGTEICSRTCQSNADCRNDGICDRDGLGYFCMCPGTFIGDRCEVDVCNYVRFECRSRGAECVRQGTIGVCECPRGKKMSPNNYCEDVCTYETCVYGTCELTGYDFSQYVCNCYEGYYGTHCENALEYTPAISLIVILASGILLFSITSIVAGCWVKRLRKKIAENSKQTGQP